MDMNAFLANVGTFVTSLVTWMTNLLTFVTDNPPLLVFVLIAFAASIIGIVRRWLPGRA